MIFHVQHDIQIARRPAELPDFSCPRETNARSVFHSRRNFSVDRPLAQNPSFTFALRARIRNHAARSLTRRAGTRNAEKSLLVTNLPATIARPAGHRPFARSRA